MTMHRFALATCLVVTVSGCATVLGVDDATHLPPCMDGRDVLIDGGFENPMAWVSDPDHSYFCPKEIAARSGAASGCLGTTSLLMETIRQDISIPEGTRSVTLSGFICIDTMEPDGEAQDVLKVELLRDPEGTDVIDQLGEVSNVQGTRGCNFQPFAFSTAHLPGDPASATLVFSATQNENGRFTTFYLDDLQVKACTR